MQPNIKIDLIYHSTPSDFEMEFNLCGCCRMRLLTDKTADRKAFVNALARSVSRSRIIIACGPLFSSEGLISTVATAIGKPLEAVENRVYGIEGDDTIDIIGGSTPLVTQSGFFGGCIIESGPQTIILLTENKTFRKEIMKNLIHPYIEEISTVQANESVPAKPKAKNTDIQEQDSEVEEVAKESVTFEAATIEICEDNTVEQDKTTEEKAEEPEEAAEEVTEEQEADASEEKRIEFVFEDDSDASSTEPAQNHFPTSDDLYSNMYIESHHSKPSSVNKYALNYTPTAQNDSFISEVEEDDFIPNIFGRRTINTAIIVLSAILLIILGILAYFIFVAPSIEGITTAQYLREIFDTAKDTMYI